MKQNNMETTLQNIMEGQTSNLDGHQIKWAEAISLELDTKFMILWLELETNQIVWGKQTQLGKTQTRRSVLNWIWACHCKIAWIYLSRQCQGGKTADFVLVGKKKLNKIIEFTLKLYKKWIINLNQS